MGPILVAFCTATLFHLGDIMSSGEKLNELMLQALKGDRDEALGGVVLGETYAVSAARLEKDVAARLFEVAPTTDCKRCGLRCLQELQSIIHQLGLDWEVQPFGSFANGFSTVYSDLDVTCCQLGLTSDAEAQQWASVALGEWILPRIRAHASFTIVEEVLSARVPILKLRFEDSLDVDVSYHNPKPLLNTALLRAYSRMDPRVRDLGVGVKLWAKAVGVCDATNSHLSSYSITLMVLYFMQVHQDVQLPLLPVEAFDGGEGESDEKVVAAMKTWSCSLTSIELMKRFFAFYSSNESNAFAWGSEVVSVRFGCRYTAMAETFSKLRGRHHRRLHIEDPYELERNLHGVLGKAEEAQLLSALTDAHFEMESNRTPSGLLSVAPPWDVSADVDTSNVRTNETQRNEKYHLPPKQQVKRAVGQEKATSGGSVGNSAQKQSREVEWREKVGREIQAHYGRFVCDPANNSESTTSGGPATSEESSGDAMAAPNLREIPLPRFGLMAGSVASASSSVSRQGRGQSRGYGNRLQQQHMTAPLNSRHSSHGNHSRQ